MPAYNSQMYLFLSLHAATNLPCPQAFLDAYPIVKTPATEGSEVDDTVYYQESDGLTGLQAMEKHGKELLYWVFDPETDTHPVTPTAEVLDEDGAVITPAVPATYVSFKLVNPRGPVILAFSAGFSAYAQATGLALNPNLAIQSRDDWGAFVGG